ncbi:MAG: hypothetical protein JO222_10065 [Frankiales bacterium]|nr:hypothetical protein [Frankiales bacterium]
MLSLALLAGCGGSGSPGHATGPNGQAVALFPLPANPMALVVKAGLTPEKKESLINHVHAHLDLFVDGRRVLVPGGIGININDPGVHKDGQGDKAGYGGISGCAQPCISPLHTHGPDGILHTESATKVVNTLGQLFTEWGVVLTRNCLGTHCGGVTAYVNGKAVNGDPGAIGLTDRLEIALVVGTPPASIPKDADFSGA